MSAAGRQGRAYHKARKRKGREQAAKVFRSWIDRNKAVRLVAATPPPRMRIDPMTGYGLNAEIRERLLRAQERMLCELYGEDYRP